MNSARVPKGSLVTEMSAMEKAPAAAKRAGTAPPELAGPRAPAKPLSFFAALRAMNDNAFVTIPVVAYEQPVWEAKGMFGNQLLVSDPAGIKRILLNNFTNYPKTALDIRILSTAFGDGLLTSDGAKARLQGWDAMDENAEIDIAREMTTLTLEVISRTMFSADSDALRSRL